MDSPWISAIRDHQDVLPQRRDTPGQAARGGGTRREFSGLPSREGAGVMEPPRPARLVSLPHGNTGPDDGRSMSEL